MTRERVVTLAFTISFTVICFVSLFLWLTNDGLRGKNLELTSRQEVLEAKLAALESKAPVTNNVAEPDQPLTKQIVLAQVTTDSDSKSNRLSADTNSESSKTLTPTKQPPVTVTFLQQRRAYNNGRLMGVANNSQNDMRFTITIIRSTGSTVYTPIIKGGGAGYGGYWLLEGIVGSVEVEISASGYVPIRFHTPEQFLYGGKPIIHVE